MTTQERLDKRPAQSDSLNSGADRAPSPPLSSSKPSVLLIDDDESFCRAMSKALRRRGFEVSVVHGGYEALEALERAPKSCVAIVDLHMPELSGLELLQRTPHRLASALMLTGHGGVPEAVEAMRAGAHTFLTKPIDAPELIPLIEQAARERERVAPRQLIGESEQMKALRQLVAQLAEAREPILLTGETGTGKEVVARALHAQSSHPEEPFVAVNMACLPRDLIESELFGHVKGAFTGAQHDKRGLFGEAQRGALFLDEVAELPLEHQAKLLRVIEQGEYRRVGGLKAERFEGRLIAATHRDLNEEVRQGRFREDLLYRLQVLPVHIPPLRERVEDISEIFKAWARRLNAPHLSLSPCAEQRLRDHPWGGNVRELVNLVRRLAVFYPQGGEVRAPVVEQLIKSNPFSTQRDLSATLSRARVSSPQLSFELPPELPPEQPLSASSMSLPSPPSKTTSREGRSAHVELGGDYSLEAIERAHIEQLINKYTNVTQVARLLQINRRTLQRKLKSWGLSGEDD